jgi:hypothetical protein
MNSSVLCVLYAIAEQVCELRWTLTAETGFLQLECNCHHHIDSHVSPVMSVFKIYISSLNAKDEDQDSEEDYSKDEEPEPEDLTPDHHADDCILS